jgi:hypothetical protein
LWFNRKQRYLGVFSNDKIETRLHIETPEDIYHHAARLRATVASYLTTDLPRVPAQAYSTSPALARPPGSAGI